MATIDARFSIGELIHHCLFDYRGVIFDADPVFQGSEEWLPTSSPKPTA